MNLLAIADEIEKKAATIPAEAEGEEAEAETSPQFTDEEIKEYAKALKRTGKGHLASILTTAALPPVGIPMWMMNAIARKNDKVWQDYKGKSKEEKKSIKQAIKELRAAGKI